MFFYSWALEGVIIKHRIIEKHAKLIVNDFTFYPLWLKNELKEDFKMHRCMNHSMLMLGSVTNIL